MDILRISDRVMKLTLTAKDMSEYSLTCDSIGKDRIRSAEALREILRDAGGEPVFYNEGDRFFVQIYPSPSGECEIFVKRLGGAVMSVTEYRRDTKEMCLAPVISGHGLFIYSFRDMSPMMHACRRLSFAKYCGESFAYLDEGERIRYYLVIEVRSPLPEEHGGILCPRNTAYYISEHCRLICSGAVDRLGGLA